MECHDPLWAGDGITVYHAAETASTNDDAAIAFSREVSGPAWFTADRQTAGRGRRGREWVDDTGNFSGSYLCPISPEIIMVPCGLSFAAALAVVSALETIGLPHDSLSLKWPNDILLGSRKLSGILTEVHSSGPRLAAVIGIGVNLATIPNATLPAGALLAACAADRLRTGVPTPTAFLAALAPALDARLLQLRDCGFAATREAWMSRAAGIGDPVVVRLADREIEGVYEGIDPEDGALLLRGEGSVLKVVAADVFLGTKRLQ